jgi:hypothetical protein
VIGWNEIKNNEFVFTLPNPSMTLIAMTLNAGNPVMIADLLWSTENQAEVPTVLLPTHLDGAPTTQQAIKPVHLTQKLYIISDTLALAFSGNYTEIRQFVNDSKLFLSDGPMSLDRMNEYLKSYPRDRITTLSIIFWIVLKEKDKVNFAISSFGNVRKVSDARFGNVYAAGSGAPQFLKILSQPNEYTEGIHNKVLYQNLCLLGYWFGNEIGSNETLINHWGAGYEMIIFKDFRLVKLDEYSVVTRIVSLGRSKLEVTGNNLINFYYKEGHLIAESFDGTQGKIITIPPIDAEPITVTELNRSLTFKNVIISYVVHNLRANDKLFPAIVLLNSTNKDEVIIKESYDDKNKYTVAIRADIENSLLEYLRQMVYT